MCYGNCCKYESWSHNDSDCNCDKPKEEKYCPHIIEYAEEMHIKCVAHREKESGIEIYSVINCEDCDYSNNCPVIGNS